MSLTMEPQTTRSTVTGPVKHAHYMGLSGSALRTAIGIVSGLCFLAFGYGQGDIGGLMLVSTFRERFPEMDARTYPTLHVATINGAVIATWNLGSLFGAVLTFFLCNVFGRKGCIIAGLTVELIGKIVQTTSFSFGQYIAGRFIAGVGNGFIASTVPAWQAECLKTHRRGTILMVSFGTCITLGLALSYWMTYAFSFTAPSSASWRVPIALSMLLILPALAIVAFLPESPRFLLLQAKQKEATKVLSALNELPPEHEDVRREILLIKNTVVKLASGGSFKNIFSNGQYRYAHRVILAIALQVFQQYTGVNLFIQYLSSMFANQLHYPVELSLLLAACCATAFFIASVLAVLGIDHFWGRRTLTMFGAAGMAICMTVLCIMAHWGTQTAYYVMTVFLFIYVCLFSIGWQGESWLWAVELIPLSIRGPANALATAANWLANFIVVLTCPIMFTNITWKTYVTYAVCNAVFVPIIYFFYPETGSRSLEEVDLLFEQAEKAGKPWLSVVSIGRKEPRWFDENGERTESYSGGDTSETYVGSERDEEKGSAEVARKHASSGSSDENM